MIIVSLMLDPIVLLCVVKINDNFNICHGWWLSSPLICPRYLSNGDALRKRSSSNDAGRGAVVGGGSEEAEIGKDHEETSSSTVQV